MKNLILVLLVCCSVQVLGQDAVYSHFWTGQNMLNPATSGHIDADYKAYAKYKNQWASITDAFRTMGAGGEYTFFKKPKNPSYLGVGLFVIQDQAGSSQLKRLQVEGSASYQLSAGPYNKFAAGIGLSYFQRSISYEGLLWDSQYNGSGVDPTIISGEDFSSDKSSSIDASLGVLWEHDKKRHYLLGLSWKHFIQPQGFLAGQQDQWIPMQVLTGAYFSNFKHFDIDYHLLVT
ncbi:MAG: PorP/SprF family type IX secretion system membrane protein, partial [Flavobacteriales bacterium]